VRDTNARNGMLAAVLQRDGDVEEPKAEDMYRIGTAARIMKILEMPNGNLTVILNGLEKVEIGEYVSSDPYLQARVTPLKDSTPDEKNVEFNALVDSIRDSGAQYHQHLAQHAQGGDFRHQEYRLRGEVSSTSSAPTSNCRTKTGSRCSKRRGCWRARANCSKS